MNPLLDIIVRDLAAHGTGCKRSARMLRSWRTSPAAPSPSARARRSRAGPCHWPASSRKSEPSAWRRLTTAGHDRLRPCGHPPPGAVSQEASWAR